MSVKDLVAGAIAEDMVSQIAPEEHEFFNEITMPKVGLKAKSDSYLGFGGEDTVMVFATTMLISVAQTIATFLWAHGKDATGQLVKDCSRSAQEAIANWFDGQVKGKNDPSPIRLSKATTGDLVRVVLISPDAAKLTPDQQTKLISWIEARLSSPA